MYITHFDHIFITPSVPPIAAPHFLFSCGSTFIFMWCDMIWCDVHMLGYEGTESLHTVGGSVYINQYRPCGHHWQRYMSDILHMRKKMFDILSFWVWFTFTNMVTFTPSIPFHEMISLFLMTEKFNYIHIYTYIIIYIYPLFIHLAIGVHSVGFHNLATMMLM